jgi:hypothetical protein
MSNGKNMTDAQIKIMIDYLSSPAVEGELPNPYIYGQDWACGNSYSEAQKQAFTDKYARFAIDHPDIWALMPLRDVKENT